MAYQLGTPKRLITYYSNKLNAILTKFKEEKLELLSVSRLETSGTTEYVRESIQRLEEGLGVIEEASAKVKISLQEYATLFAGTEEPSQKEVSDFTQYTSSGEEALISAFDYELLLHGRLRSFKSYNGMTTTPQVATGVDTLPITQPKKVDLPALPIPTFRGNIWEWDNFWKLFESNVHSQDLPMLFKFNYLLSALRGEALESVRRFQVTAENYHKVVDFLKSKYGNTEELVFRLVDKLERCTLRSSNLRDQRSLLEQIHAIVEQLKQKNEHVNSQWLLKKILSKFPDSVQRRVLAKKQTTSGETFTMESLLKYLDDTISSEEMMSLYTGQQLTTEKNQDRHEKHHRLTQKGHNRTCMYCKKDHKSSDCDKFKTPQERSKYLREKKLCLICASPHHMTNQCGKPMCFKCQKPHHTSCCFQLPKQVQSSDNTTGSAEHKQHRSEAVKHPQKTHKSTIKVNQIGQDNSEIDGTSILEVLPEQLSLHSGYKTFLPTGEVTLLDHNTKTLRTIPVLLDSGAEVSFIDTALANELQLPILAQVKLRLHTFGSIHAKESICHQVMLNVWDKEGKPFPLNLLTHDILTKPFDYPSLQEEDQEFLRKREIFFSNKHVEPTVKPLILLGSDQLWSLIQTKEPHVKLPSGLHLLTTRIGHLLTGQLQHNNNSKTENEDIDKWDGYWTLDGHVNTVVPDAEEEDDQEKWDRYWKLDSAGTEEFTSSEKDIRAIEDRQVWDKFKQTIEKRKDGYYVRLPWKNVSAILPDNRSLAYHRLLSVWNSLKKDEHLLDRYNDIFQEQLNLNILEEVEGDIASGPRIHYIPHQAILTPHKTTTKMRIVYDASAHYKGCPSLNDLLHRGPVILPSLFGILLRFRLGKIALISDVEKAFLQVRLHEDDRDATRCLWLRDHKLPPSPDNIKTLRFTRVTFGLNSSPFLLAGTTFYHLDQYHGDTQLIANIKENLYVDNLILTSDSYKDALYTYSTTKTIFSDLNMNIREFVSNNTRLMSEMAEKDKSTETCPKVLGITWISTSDRLEVSTRPLDKYHITKRTVASALASIYDPLGWLTPLIHNMKVFLRSLWQELYDWDFPLSNELGNKWLQICEDVEGFRKSFPRFLAEKQAKAMIVTFADASNEAIASCVYLRIGSASNLLMAKSKLPPLKSKTTIPKMELDAVTLAMRLTNSIIAQIKTALAITQVFVLSDSEIVLKWIQNRPLKDVGVMISNRLLEIDRIVSHLQSLGHQVQFGYIPSHLNPADCATRGLTKHDLPEHFWWTGPDILQSPPQSWTEVCDFFHIDSEREHSSIQSHEEGILFTSKASTTQKVIGDDQELFSVLAGKTFLSAKRITALVIRFLAILIKKVNRRLHKSIQVSATLTASDSITTSISGREITAAEKLLVKLHQRARINPSILRNLHHLNVQSDEEQLYRCIGRLGCSELGTETKFPLLIVQNSWLAEAIIRDRHDTGHPGIGHTMSLVRERFWIPKLRAQVTRILRKCVPCQKFNNPPYKYPNQGHLPEQRVSRSRPFLHVGLDYFGPLTTLLVDSSEGKSYGCIITCMTTRLIHLDAATDLSTIAFLRILRRFFSRRGTPKSITSDNSPTFILGDKVLSECLCAAQKDPQVQNFIANREIEWRYITPYAPWQGGFYERLIKSVKYSLFKSLGKVKPSHDEMITILTEIGSMLNTRPLLYVESDSQSAQVLRPIDFLQCGFEIPCPMDKFDEDHEDELFAPVEVQTALRTKKQVQQALQSSCQSTERFWQIWQTQYLTSLREKHKLEVGKQRGSIYTPKKDAIVLISDPMQPRYCWKMGRIQELIGRSGEAREAVITLPSRRTIRRPVNQLVPLELDIPPSDGEPEENPSTMQEHARAISSSDQQAHSSSRYDLRPRKRVNYNVEAILKAPQVQTLLMLLSLCILPHATSSEKTRSIQCSPGGVELASYDHVPYEICAEEVCMTFDQPRELETVKFPPHVILHEHRLQWKFASEVIGTIETVCPAAPFCDHLDCTFCSALIFNPECWPVGAIIATGFMIYLLLTGCYVFLFIPLVLGSPVRILANFLWKLTRQLFTSIWKICRKPQHRTSRARALDLVELLAAASLIASTLSLSECCQQVNLFSHSFTICVNSTKEIVCRVHLSEILKLNGFKKEACFKLMRENVSLHELRVEWKTLILTCEPQTMAFTRDTAYHIVDSKRCPHTGSCVGQKCAAINASSLLPELKEGNDYPGATMCVESCGGPGCDCFYWSSGCLFYRIYIKPVSQKVYEIFRCNRWQEAAKVRFTHFDVLQQRTHYYTAHMIPSVPNKWNSFTLTLSLASTVPTPILTSPFITDGSTTAIWDSDSILHLWCENESAARNLRCEMIDNCLCHPAETHINCKCKNMSILAWVQDLRHRQPLVLPQLTFRQNKNGQVQATVPRMTTAEIIVTISGNMTTHAIVNDVFCTITNSALSGCYKCAKGALAQVTCTSTSFTQAEVICDTISFTVDCDPSGKTTALRFSFDRARIYQKCMISCGRTRSHFELGGILKFTHSARAIADRWIKGNIDDNPNAREIDWPDFWHIYDVFSQWYKTLIATVAGLLMLIAFTYILISTCGLRIARWLLYLIIRFLTLPIRCFFRALLSISKNARKGHDKWL